MNPTLYTFYNNENERETVKAFMLESLREMAIERVMDGDPVTGIKECNDLVGEVFNKLEEIYGKTDKPLPNNPR